MKEPNLRARYGGLLLLAILSACGPPAEPGAQKRSPTALIPPLESQQTPDQVRAALGAVGGWVTLEDSEVGPRDGCPRFNVLSISVPGWSHLGEKGDLRLGFVNGVLHSTWFYPESPQGYLAALEAAGIALDQVDHIGAHFTTRPPRTRIWKWKAYDGRDYVGWEDEAIREEMHAWISSCA